MQLRHLLLSMAFNLGVMMRKLFNMGTPRGLQGWHARLVLLLTAWYRLMGWAIGYYHANQRHVRMAM